MYRGIYILYEKLTSDKFYRLHEGPETCMKIQHPKLPYPAHNACSAIAWLNCQANAGPKQNADVASCFDVPVRSNCIMKCKTSGVLRSAELGVVVHAGHPLKAKIIGNR